MIFNKTHVPNSLTINVLFAFVLLTCKQHELKYEKNLKVEISFKTQAKGHMYFLLDKLEDNKNYSLKKKVPLFAEESNQTLSFDIKSLTTHLPSYIQIRISDDVDSLKINFVKLNFKHNELFISGKDLKRYFILQKGVSFNHKNHYLNFEKNLKLRPKLIRLNPNFIYYLERKF